MSEAKNIISPRGDASFDKHMNFASGKTTEKEQEYKEIILIFLLLFFFLSIYSSFAKNVHER